MWCARGQSERTTSCKGKIPWVKGNYVARWAELFMQIIRCYLAGYEMEIRYAPCPNPMLYGQLADRPTRRQLNWPKNQLAEIDIVTKIDVRFFGHMDVSFW